MRDNCRRDHDRIAPLAEISSFYSITSLAREASRLTDGVVGHSHSCSNAAERSASMNRLRSWDNMKG
jgi:hypothetical protein